MSKENFTDVFNSLRNVLKKYGKQLKVTRSKSDCFSVDAIFIDKSKRSLFFGSVQIKKNYVTFYLMPVYVFPELLKNISPPLRKRMHGKSCFSFTTIDKSLFKELEQLTESGLQKIKAEGILE